MKHTAVPSKLGCSQYTEFPGVSVTPVFKIPTLWRSVNIVTGVGRSSGTPHKWKNFMASLLKLQLRSCKSDKQANVNSYVIVFPTLVYSSPWHQDSVPHWGTSHPRIPSLSTTYLYFFYLWTSLGTSISGLHPVFPQLPQHPTRGLLFLAPPLVFPQFHHYWPLPLTFLHLNLDPLGALDLILFSHKYPWSPMWGLRPLGPIFPTIWAQRVT